MANNVEWSLQVRPIDGLTPAGLQNKQWIMDLDESNYGIGIALTDWVDSSLFGGDPDSTWADVIALAQYLLQYSDGRSWFTTSEGVLAPPQRSEAPGQAAPTWYLNLCCFQETLGQVCALLNAKTFPKLAPFAMKVFPNVTNFAATPDPDLLGAFFIRLQPNMASFTDADAAAYRARIIYELKTWALCLVQKDATNTVTILRPANTLTDVIPAQLFRPQPELMFVQSLAPPNAAACDAANTHPRGPFPPGKCAPPCGKGCGAGCYFPYKGYPDCCFSRAYQIRSRCF